MLLQKKNFFLQCLVLIPSKQSLCSKLVLCQGKYRLIFKLLVLVDGLEQKFAWYILENHVVEK